MQVEPVKEPVKVVEAVEAEAVVVPVINDSSAGLARMYQDLALPAAQLRSAAILLLFISILFMGSIEGMFGLISATGVLCCAAPGSLGTAYAARCTRITATIAASLALMHVCLSTFAVAVLPEMPHAFEHACSKMHNDAKLDAKLKLPAPGPEDGAASILIGTLFDNDMFAPPSQFGEDFEPHPKKTAAHAVAFVASTASRRLQELVPSAFDPATDHCSRAQRVFAEAAPTIVYSAIFGELVLFMAAMSTARAAARLTLLARSFGANAM